MANQKRTSKPEPVRQSQHAGPSHQEQQQARHTPDLAHPLRDLSSADILLLQRSVGNRAVQRLLARPGDRKFAGPEPAPILPARVGDTPREAHEPEARLPERPLSHANRPVRSATPASTLIQRVFWTWNGKQWVPDSSTSNQPPNFAGNLMGQTYDDVSQTTNPPLDLVSSFFGAVASGNSELVSKLAEDNQSICDWQDSNLNTPLHIAIQHQQVDIINLLLKYKANPDVLNKARYSPLHLATKLQNTNIVEILLVGQADVNQEDGENNTALHIAICLGNKDIVIILLDNNASIDAEGNNFDKPLHMAVRSRNVEIVTILLQRGAISDDKDSEDDTPLHIAVNNQDLQMVGILCDHKANIEEQNLMQETPLHRAIIVKNEEIIKFLLSKGADIKALDHQEYTTLHQAIYAQNSESVIDTLLKEDHELIESKDHIGNTPLILAVQKNLSNIVLFLLKEQADINAENNSGNTALHIAAGAGMETIVALLLSSNANIHAQNKEGDTPLHIAVSRATKVDISKATPQQLKLVAGADVIVAMLLKAGAKLNIPNNKKQVPLAKAHLYNEKIIRLLRGSYIENLRDGYIKGFKILLQNRLAENISIDPSIKPSVLKVGLEKLVFSKYNLFINCAQQQCDKLHSELISMEIMAFYDMIQDEYEASESNKLKLLAHLFSLAGEKKVGDIFSRQNVDLEGFMINQAIFHDILGLQHALNQSQEENRQQILIQEIVKYIKGFERSIEIQLISNFFKPIGMLEQASQILANSIMQIELTSKSGFLLPSGYSGDFTDKGIESGHAMYISGQGDFNQGGGTLMVHNLGALSGRHKKDDSRSQFGMICLYPYVVENVSSNQGLSMWMTDMIKAQILSSNELTRLVNYQDIHISGSKKVSEETMNKMPAQEQQIVGNCSIENLNNVLLTTLYGLVGSIKGQEFFNEIQSYLKDFAIMYAKEKSDQKLLKMIEEIIGKELKETQFITAARKGNLNDVKELLQTGVNINAKNSSGKTALAVAVQYYHEDVIVYLLHQGADLGTVSDREMAALLLYDKWQALAALLDRGANPNAKFGATSLLMLAVMSKNEDIVRLLLSKGVDPNIVDEGGLTALDHAEKRNLFSIKLRLLSAGAQSKLKALTWHSVDK